MSEVVRVVLKKGFKSANKNGIRYPGDEMTISKDDYTRLEKIGAVELAGKEVLEEPKDEVKEKFDELKESGKIEHRGAGWYSVKGKTTNKRKGEIIRDIEQGVF